MSVCPHEAVLYPPAVVNRLTDLIDLPSHVPRPAHSAADYATPCWPWLGETFRYSSHYKRKVRLPYSRRADYTGYTSSGDEEYLKSREIYPQKWRDPYLDKYVHRLLAMYRLLCGPVPRPASHLLRRSCESPLCLNPFHTYYFHEYGRLTLQETCDVLGLTDRPDHPLDIYPRIIPDLAHPSRQTPYSPVTHHTQVPFLTTLRNLTHASTPQDQAEQADWPDQISQA